MNYSSGNPDTTRKNEAKENSQNKAKKRSLHNHIFQELCLEDNYLILFIDGSQDYVSQDIDKFWQQFINYKNLLDEKNYDYDFTYIIFPQDPDNILSNHHKYTKKVDFSNCIFNTQVNFSEYKI